MARIAFFIALLMLMGGCSRETIPACQDGTSLYSYASFPIGAAIDVYALANDSAYRKIAVNQFNSVTPENCFKAAYLHPEPLVFDWSQADSLVQFCIANNKRIHGHTLVWHQQLPEWMLHFEGDAQAWEQLLKQHIQSIVGHFKGKVHAWDVVNEAFNEDGTFRDNLWYQKIGESYIEKSFKFAQEADPAVLLFYNDYNLEMNASKRTSVIRHLNLLRAKGLKIDGIGFQMHLNIDDARPAEINDAFGELAKNGYSIHLSEIDVSVNPHGTEVTPTLELFEEQASLLGRVIFYYRQLPANLQYGITFWGISDKYTWIRPYYNRMDYPLLYDEIYHPKPAYCVLKALL
jgi:endo-1,4-beta-xylanase